MSNLCKCQWWDMWKQECVIPAEMACEKQEIQPDKVFRSIPLPMIFKISECRKCPYHNKGQCTLTPQRKCIKL